MSTAPTSWNELTVAAESSMLPLLRSRRALEAEGTSLLPPGALRPTDLPIGVRGTTYSMAQESIWVDNAHFAVGRWDGSLSVFSFENAPNTGPEITVAASDQSAEGVQMLESIAPLGFVSSGGPSQLTVWTAADAQWQRLTGTSYAYDAKLEAANSAVYIPGAPWIAVGHASGFLTVWSINPSLQLSKVGELDLRNPHPVNPWGIHNIRGVKLLRPGLVVAGSEDGYISVVDIVQGKIIAQVVYNPVAQRGINGIALSGLELLVANCSVGPTDSNLWLYNINPGTLKPELCDRARLVVNQQAPQVFNFCVEWGNYQRNRGFFCSTEEGALWAGKVSGGQIEPFGYIQVTPALGSAIANQPDGRLALVGYDLHQYDTSVPSG